MDSCIFWPIVPSTFPQSTPDGLWDRQAQLGAADVWLDTPDGFRVHGWLINRQDAGFVTLFLHGNTGNITDRYAHIREIAAAGCSILALDYRGYGKSNGRPTEKGIHTDAETAYVHLVRVGYRPNQIILHGESLGTAVAVNLASHRECGAVVLESPFTSAKDVARTVLPFLGPMLVWGLDSREKIGRIHAPMFFIHGDRDNIIPLTLGQALFVAAPEPKSFWIVPGAGHNDIVEAAGESYRQSLRSFYPGPSPRSTGQKIVI